MDTSSTTTNKAGATPAIAFAGGGPASLVAAIALARHGLHTTVFERDQHPEVALRFNPDRSYTIDISGHGLKALRHIDACSYFDERMIQFKGLKIPGGATEEWTLPGWGAQPYIDFRSNTSSTDRRSTAVWKRMYSFYLNNRDWFMQHYHKRSNVETTFSMIKGKFGERLKSKTTTAQTNEVLCKVLCHNICCLIQSIYELGIEPTFWE
jgi:hypothetical protein